jgi:hypothetical protein
LVAGAAVRIGSLFDQAPAPAHKSLSVRELAIMTALIEALFPGGDMPAAERDHMIPWADEFLARTDRDVRLLFKSMLHVIEEESRVLRFSRFSKLSLADRMSEVRAWEVTPIYLKRSAFNTVKLVSSLAYFEQPGVNEALGWYVGCAPEHLIHKSKGAHGTS